jgi:hypothetical protein
MKFPIPSIHPPSAPHPAILSLVGCGVNSLWISLWGGEKIKPPTVFSTFVLPRTQPVHIAVSPWNIDPHSEEHIPSRLFTPLRRREGPGSSFIKS